MAGPLTTLTLYVDVQNRQLVAGLLGGPYSLPAFFQNNSQAFKLIFLVPNGSPFGNPQPYLYAPVSSLPLTVSIGAQPTSSGSTSPAAEQTVWTWNAVDSSFNGTLSLNTTALNTLITNGTPLFFELDFANPDGSLQSVLQIPVTAKPVYGAGPGAPNPSPTYFTVAQGNAFYAKKTGLPGETITLVSPGNVYTRTLGIDDAGTAIDVIAHV